MTRKKIIVAETVHGKTGQILETLKAEGLKIEAAGTRAGDKGAGSVTKFVAHGDKPIGHDTLTEKDALVNHILDECKAKLDQLGCQYFLAALRRDPEAKETDKVFVNSELVGSDMGVILKHGFPHNRDLIYLGTWVGQEILRRNEDNRVQFKNKSKKASANKNK